LMLGSAAAPSPSASIDSDVKKLIARTGRKPS
jgi:hypothetical protein